MKAIGVFAVFAFLLVAIAMTFGMIPASNSGKMAEAVDGLIPVTSDSYSLEDSSVYLQVDVTKHAFDSAHPEAAELRKCVENDQIYQTFRDMKDKTKFYFICQLRDKRWGVIPVVLESATLIMKTAFVPRDGSWNMIMAYVQQTATRFNGAIPGIVR